MGARLTEPKTIPCPPPEECGPESGEYLTDHVSIRSSHPAQRFAQTVEEELRERLAGVCCPEHGEPALVELSIADDGAVQVIPIGCCEQLNRLILAALRQSVTLAPPCDPELTIPREG